MADMYLDVDVAVTILVNLLPLTDDTDFKSREISVAYDAGGMDLVWNFTTSAGVVTQTAVTPSSGSVSPLGNYAWTHVGDGMYTILIPASGGASISNNQEGYGYFTGYATGVLPWRSPIYCFRAANINDALCDTTTLITSDDIGLLYEGSISTVNSQTSFDMDTGIVTDDNWINQTAVIRDISTGDKWVTYVTDVDQANNRLILNEAPPFTAVAGDEIRVFAYAHPAVTSAPSAASIASAVLGSSVEDQGSGYSLQEAVSLILAEAVGESDYNTGTTTWTVSLTRATGLP
jgi:aspartate 1-decarboxylase